jgi:hypothetical protein
MIFHWQPEITVTTVVTGHEPGELELNAIVCGNYARDSAVLREKPPWRSPGLILNQASSDSRA